MDAFVRVMPASELAAGEMRSVRVGERDIVLCHAKDGVHALDDVCTHAFARMHEGRLRGHRLICPLHGASFDVRSGAVLGAPASQPLRTYAVRLNEGYIEVQA